jgi:SpoVK/Ycf46/Vps4 family AAA+-type ATPase
VIISSFLGETATNLRKMFEYAARRPCVLLLDEFDALARTRSDSSEHSEMRRVVNSLLLAIERYRSRGVLIAATNLQGSLDDALWRRFDDAIYMPPPDDEAIRGMLALKFKNYRTTFRFDPHVDSLRSFSYADIERVSLASIKRAVLEGKKKVTVQHFNQALADERRRKALQHSGSRPD